MNKLLYSRILIKLSGDFFKKEKYKINESFTILNFINNICELSSLGVEIGIVIGGGNLFKGKNLKSLKNLDVIIADQIGIMSTIINGLFLYDILRKTTNKVAINSSIPIPSIMNTYNRDSTVMQLKKGCIVIFVGGIGSALVTTDSAASVRAIETKSNVLIKATNVNGVYNFDPKIHNNAKIYNNLSYDLALKNKLSIMDLNAIQQCKDYKIKINVFNFSIKDALLKIIYGQKIGTTIS